MPRIPGIRRLFRLAGRDIQAEIDDELRFHLETRVDSLARAGLPRDRARREAEREFGDLARARAELETIDRRRVGKVRRAQWWAGLAQDVRHAARGLLRRPGFTAITLATLAIGIGANVAIFTVVDAALLRPLPYAHPDRLVHLWELNANDGSHSEASYPDYLDWVAESRAFAAMGGYQRARFVVTGGDRAEAVEGARVTSSFLDVLGVRPVVGRGFATGEDANATRRVALVSWGYWQRQLGGDRSVIGRRLSLDGVPVQIVGVLPRDFQFAAAGSPDVVIPIDDQTPTREARGSHWVNVVARLAPGVTREQAQGELSAVMKRLGERYPDSNAQRDAIAIPLRDELVGPVRPILLVLYAAVGLVMLVACANVASLLLVRGAARSRELAIRAAIGAGRGRLVRLLLAETGILAVLGAALALAVAPLAVRLLLVPIPATRLLAMPYLATAAIDARIVWYTLAITAAAALLFGIAPALQLARPSLGDMLKEGGQRGTSGRAAVRRALVVGEMALTLVLVSAAMLLTRSLAHLMAVDTGFRPEGVLTFRTAVSPVRYPKPEQRVAFYDRLVNGLSALPGVESVGLTTKLPLDAGNTVGFTVIGEPPLEPGREPSASFRTINESYFTALGAPLVRGRFFQPSDAVNPAPGKYVAIVNRGLERALLGGRSALGREVDFGRFGTATVVGVVGDVTIGRLDEPVPPTLYIYHRQDSQRAFAVVVRTRGDPNAVAEPARRLLASLEPDAPMMQVRSMPTFVETTPSVFTRRYPMLLIGAFAAVALLLAVIGIYGVMSFSVAQRTRELGIRIALGATRREIAAIVVRDAALLALAGAAIGIPLAIALTRLLASLLYGVSSRDPLTYASVSALLFAVAVAASWAPARRATRVDPLEALRAE